MMYFRRSLSGVYTMQIDSRDSSAGDVRAGVDANRIIKVATRFRVKPVELFITCMKRLRAHHRHFTRASKLSWCKCGVTFPFLSWLSYNFKYVINCIKFNLHANMSRQEAADHSCFLRFYIRQSCVSEVEAGCFLASTRVYCWCVHVP
jgi:hypothetical protein